jgi:hypothetical protein
VKELEKENGKLKRLVAELSLDKQILKDIAEGTSWNPSVSIEFKKTLNLVRDQGAFVAICAIHGSRLREFPVINSLSWYVEERTRILAWADMVGDDKSSAFGFAEGHFVSESE